MKKCTQCKQLLEDSAFHKSSRNKDGLYSRCKSCRKGEHTEYYSTKRKKRFGISYNRKSSVFIR